VCQVEPVCTDIDVADGPVLAPGVERITRRRWAGCRLGEPERGPTRDVHGSSHRHTVVRASSSVVIFSPALSFPERYSTKERKDKKDFIL